LSELTSLQQNIIVNDTSTQLDVIVANSFMLTHQISSSTTSIVTTIVELLLHNLFRLQTFVLVSQ